MQEVNQQPVQAVQPAQPEPLIADEHQRIYDPRTANLPAEPAPKPEHGHTWLRVLASILIGLVLVVLIVLLARWIYHKTHHTTINRPTTSQSSPQPSPAPNPPAASSPTPTPSPAPTPTPPPTSVANTGPGNVIGIFAAASVAAAGLHYIISARRANKLT